MGKLRQSPPTTSFHRAPWILDVVHSDVIGPITPATTSGFKYILNFVDDYTRYNHVYLLQNKNDTFVKFQHYKALIENQTGRPIVNLKTDRGGGYSSEEFLTFLQKDGIQTERGLAHRPMANLVSECFNWTLLSCMQSQLVQCGLPLSLLGELALYSSHQIDWSPSKTINFQTGCICLSKPFRLNTILLTTIDWSLLAVLLLLTTITAHLKLVRWQDVSSLWVMNQMQGHGDCGIKPRSISLWLATRNFVETFFQPQAAINHQTSLHHHSQIYWIIFCLMYLSHLPRHLLRLKRLTPLHLKWHLHSLRPSHRLQLLNSHQRNCLFVTFLAGLLKFLARLLSFRKLLLLSLLPDEQLVNLSNHKATVPPHPFHLTQTTPLILRLWPLPTKLLAKGDARQVWLTQLAFRWCSCWSTSWCKHPRGDVGFQKEARKAKSST